MAISISNHRLAGTPYVPSPNSGGALQPKFIVIHYTASGEGFDTAAYFAKRAAKASAHLVIRRDGTLVQCTPFNMIAWHAGKSQWTGVDGKHYVNLNRHAIGLEIENWGPLRKSAAGWVSWSGTLVDGSRVVAARHKFGGPDCGWELFTEAQVEAAFEAARAICAVYGIAEIVGHDDIAPGRKSDPGPAWDMEGFRAGVLAANKRVA
ncbi:MAG: N-acetylmuramoyl-L-alanine amidase [Devosia sp.]